MGFTDNIDTTTVVTVGVGKKTRANERVGYIYFVIITQKNNKML